ncbi:ATP-binding cassette domain-containing protein [Gordonia pseudamarae]|jgi:putative ABC transport system ATP-binding protein|uniref:ATP-binding cassette domain-containing protein n=1 Tax=Gordonia pseudamarae TaxID=2831662 RepID=A0ABX6IH88_9ACTN|nr:MULTISPECIES: phosphate ABC transporter ATP-binding protein [Gordonia]MBD0020403.1 phosphate ABC transporter ATP-binding protein [Gordonia sp. (in: high G+C Gram-positive bacteria)]QHN25738.1 ATP-binding cassette domain-containing protein [Gordonia pseudamarae]QHN34670.1 ATP-binding cassette domain-containing protein [Gordonia pseudamarae]
MNALFELSGLTVARDDARLLDDVTVAIPDTGVTAVIGASGSGKSTLLRCCNLLESPTAGRIAYRGTDLAEGDPRALRRRVAMVFQKPTVFPGTVIDNLRAADPQLTPDGAGELLSRVGLSADALDRVADTMSGGEAQRLCLARALATEPEVLLADEATSALDETSTAVLETLATRLAATGTPVVWVTHHMGQMNRIADHVIQLDHGRLVYAGEVSGLPADDGPGAKELTPGKFHRDNKEDS